jgi:hypothetical protein
MKNRLIRFLLLAAVLAAPVAAYAAADHPGEAGSSASCCPWCPSR